MCAYTWDDERWEEWNEPSTNANDIWVIATDYLYEKQDTLGASQSASSSSSAYLWVNQERLFHVNRFSAHFLFFIYFTQSSSAEWKSFKHPSRPSMWIILKLEVEMREKIILKRRRDCLLRTQKKNIHILHFLRFTLIRHFLLYKIYLMPNGQADKADFQSFICRSRYTL